MQDFGSDEARQALAKYWMNLQFNSAPSKLTIMVTFYVVSEYSSTQPKSGGGEKVPGGPLYELGRVKSIVADGTGLQLWTRDCAMNVRELGWDSRDVADLVLKLKSSNYIDSEWCENGRGAWAACDAYSIRVTEWIQAAQKKMQIEYFLKFSINKLGNMILTISCHT